MAAASAIHTGGSSHPLGLCHRLSFVSSRLRSKLQETLKGQARARAKSVARDEQQVAEYHDNSEYFHVVELVHSMVS